MATRRSFLAVLAGTVTAGCVDGGGSGGDGEETAVPTTEAERETPAGDPSYVLIAAPVGVDDGLEPVLSTDDEAVVAIDGLASVITRVAETYNTEYESLSAAEVEAFRALTADVEKHFAGNPPGYYIDHEGLSVSVTLRGD